MHHVFLVALVLLSLPILLLVYQPRWKLEAVGLLLSAIGYTVSPLILFGALLYTVFKAWNP